MYAREQLDQYPRVVTLDTQYRMHPRLGKLVSQCFYESHNEARLESGRLAIEFQHTISRFMHDGQPLCAAWLDVPLRPKRGEVRDGTSWTRPAEAAAIVRQVKEMAAAGQRLTIGVISFYRAQVNVLWDMFVREGLALRENDDDPPKPVNGLALQVGTVDAFQGLEFDVVFLSMTRSNTHPAGTDDERRRKYGHLCIENRLCVAMSRAKRLLVVVGDAAMVQHPAAKEDIRGLVAFHKLCAATDAKEERHGIVVPA